MPNRSRACGVDASRRGDQARRTSVPAAAARTDGKRGIRSEQGVGRLSAAAGNRVQIFARLHEGFVREQRSRRGAADSPEGGVPARLLRHGHGSASVDLDMQETVGCAAADEVPRLIRVVIDDPGRAASHLARPHHRARPENSNRWFGRRALLRACCGRDFPSRGVENTGRSRSVDFGGKNERACCVQPFEAGGVMSQVHVPHRGEQRAAGTADRVKKQVSGHQRAVTTALMPKRDASRAAASRASPSLAYGPDWTR